MISYFLEKYPDHNNGIKTVDNEIIEIFMKYDWPGNVRELENTIKKLTTLSKISKQISTSLDKKNTSIIDDIPELGIFKGEKNLQSVIYEILFPF